MINGKERTNNVIPLQKCQKSQWVKINQNMDKTYDKIGMDAWLCPADGLTL